MPDRRPGDKLARCPLPSGGDEPAVTDARAFNDRVVLANLEPGEGLFTSALRRHLKRERRTVRLFAHDLAAELAGETSVSPDLVRALAS